MDSVTEIEHAIENLPPAEFNRIVQWIREKDQALWDAQLDADSVGGKLDQLFAEVQPDSGPAVLREWPASN